MICRKFITMYKSYQGAFNNKDVLVFILKLSGEKLYREIYEIWSLDIHKTISNNGELRREDLDIFSELYMKKCTNIDKNKEAIILWAYALDVVIDEGCLREAKRLGVSGIKINQCKSCGKFFKGKSANIQYCSQECKNNINVRVKKSY